MRISDWSSDVCSSDLIDSDEALAIAAGDIGTPIFHPVGTCRMGGDTRAVVAARLKVQGLPGLRNADAWVMPAIPHGTTITPTISIDAKAANNTPPHTRREGKERVVTHRSRWWHL